MMWTQLKGSRSGTTGCPSGPRDPAIDSNMDARGPSANLPGIWKGDPTQQEQADKTKREQVTLLEAMGKLKGKLSNEEHEEKTLEEMSNGPLSILTE